MKDTIVKARKREWLIYSDDENKGHGIDGRTVYADQLGGDGVLNTAAFFDRASARRFIETEARRKESETTGLYGDAKLGRFRGLEVEFVGKLTDGPSRYVPVESYTAQTQDGILWDLEQRLGHFPEESEVEAYWKEQGWENTAQRSGSIAV